MSLKHISAGELQTDSIHVVKVNRDKNNAEDVKYYNADGFLSAYAHSCGYMDSLYYGPYTLTLRLDGYYHVILHGDNVGRVLWNTFESRRDAKRCFLKLRTMIKGYATLSELKRQST